MESELQPYTLHLPGVSCRAAQICGQIPKQQLLLVLNLLDSCWCRKDHQAKQEPLAQRTAALPVMAPVMAPQLHSRALLHQMLGWFIGEKAV